MAKRKNVVVFFFKNYIQRTVHLYYKIIQNDDFEHAEVHYQKTHEMSNEVLSPGHRDDHVKMKTNDTAKTPNNLAMGSYIFSRKYTIC